MASSHVLPGAGRGPSGGLYAWLLGGSLDAAGAQELHPDDYAVLDGTVGVIRVAVRDDGDRAGPGSVLTVQRAVRDIARAERAARSAADRWHLEEYRFAGWDHLPWSRARTARYRLVRIRRVVAQPQGRRWLLAAGPEVPEIPGLGVRSWVQHAQWSASGTDVRQAGDVFDRLCARFAGSPLDPVLDGHRSAVMSARQLAAELVRLGQDLSLPAVTAHPADLAELTARLGDCRQVLVTAIREVSHLHLQALGHAEPVGPEVVERLRQVGTALSELQAVPVPAP